MSRGIKIVKKIAFSTLNQGCPKYFRPPFTFRYSFWGVTKTSLASVWSISKISGAMRRKSASKVPFQKILVIFQKKFCLKFWIHWVEHFFRKVIREVVFEKKLSLKTAIKSKIGIFVGFPPLTAPEILSSTRYNGIFWTQGGLDCTILPSWGFDC